jgi:hypothetical protein
MFAALVLNVLVSQTHEVATQTSQPVDTTATRPAKTPPAQTSIPNAEPAATTTETTGETNQADTIKKN